MTIATVLIADDSLLIRAVVRTNLESEGYRVEETVDGATTLEHCRQHPPDVVLLDIEMPGMDGYQVLAELKADDQLKDVPVVFLTGRTGMQDVVSALRRGAHDYLKKPFEEQELLARVGSAVHIKQLQDQLRERNDLLDRISRTDALTGVYNRRHLDEELRRRHTDARRHDEPLCVLMLDIEHFKAVNDTYGHPAGDLVLQVFARRVQSSLRAGDVAGRWGGEEFLVILPRTDVDQGRQVAERIRSATAAAHIEAGEQTIRITVSVGCAAGRGDSPEAIVARADSCLYQAKSSGRNKIVAHPSPNDHAAAGSAGRVRDAGD